MAELHFVQYDDPKVFLDAVEAYDDNSTNYAVGPIYDRLDPAFSEGEEPWEIRAKDQHTFMAVWKADELV